MFIKPNPQRLEENANFVVPDPVRMDKLPKEGRKVESSLYWNRRFRDGDIIEADEPETEQSDEGEKA